MANYAGFIARYPEFADSNRDLVECSLVDAALYVDPVAFGDRTDHAIYLKAAHFVAMNPLSGECAKLQLRDGSMGTLYAKAFEDLQCTLPAGGCVI